MRVMLLFRDFEDAEMIISADNDTMSTTVRIDTLTLVLGNYDRTQLEEAFSKGNVADDTRSGVRVRVWQEKVV